MKARPLTIAYFLLLSTFAFSQGAVPTGGGGGATEASDVSIVDADEHYTGTDVESVLAEVGDFRQNVGSFISAGVLVTGAEATNAITQSWQLYELLGGEHAVAEYVLVRTVPITTGKGAITVTAGTLKKQVSANEVWIQTTAAGAFEISVANDQAEVTLVLVSPCLSGFVNSELLTFN